MPIIDAVYERGQFFLPLSINGSAPHHFILDTGAGVSAVDAAVARQLKLPVIAHTELAGTAGVLDVHQVRIARTAPLRRGRRVDELSLYGLMPTTQDLSGFEVPIPNTREAGLLGNDYLEGFVVHMQFAPPSLEIARPTGFAPAGVDPERFVPFVLDDHNIVRVQGTLDGWLTVDLRFDTGAATMTVPSPYVSITAPMWRALCDRQPGYTVTDTVTVTGIGGEIKLEIGEIASLDVGCLHFDRPRVVVQPPVGLFANPDAPGFIALNLLEPNGWATFDYPNGRIYL